MWKLFQFFKKKHKQNNVVKTCPECGAKLYGALVTVCYNCKRKKGGNRMSKQEIIREIEQLGSTDSALKMALSPLLSMLQSGSAVNYAMFALTLTQLADSFEITGTADSATISKLRQIEAKLKML